MLTDLPNLLTLSRIAAIPVLVGLMAIGDPRADFAGCVVFTVAAITDYFDGHFARRWRQNLRSRPDARSDRRQAAGRRGADDAGGDRSAVAVRPLSGDRHHAAEILVSGLREYLAGVRVGLPVTKLAKWKTGFQMGALGTLVAGDGGASVLRIGFLPVAAIGETILGVAAALTLVTGWDYLTAGIRHAATPAGIPGAPATVDPLLQVQRTAPK